MPEICCNCGAPAGEECARVYGSTWSGSKLMALDVPLCDECGRAQQAISKRRRAGCVSSSLLFLALGVAGLVTAVGGSADGSRISGPFFLAARIILALGLLLYALLPLLALREERDLFRRISRAVRIKNYTAKTAFDKGSLTVEMANQAFAEEFVRINKEDLLLK